MLTTLNRSLNVACREDGALEDRSRISPLSETWNPANAFRKVEVTHYNDPNVSNLKETNEGKNGLRASNLTRSETLPPEIVERLPADPTWRPGMDPTYSGPYPFFRLTKGADFEPVQSPERNQAVLQQVVWKEQWQRLSREVLPVGQRIRHLRLALDWTQSTIAARLGVSRRTVIRHENGQCYSMCLPHLLRLQELELAHAKELKGV